MHNLITDPVMTLRLADGATGASLPETLALMLRDRVLDFPALRPHQAPAWHAFLVQLAFLATEESAELPADAAGWAAALRALTPDWPQDEPWCLVARPDAPALLQPAAGASLDSYGTAIDTPDELDTLVTSKNHDLKAARMRDARPEDWLFALVTLQTTEGVMGAGKYGIMRMNGGYGSRPFLGVQPAGHPGARLRRDLVALRRRRDTLAALTEGFATDRSIGLLWLEPWDGSRQLTTAALHPLVIEICRRVRLVESSDGSVRARGTGSAVRRIDAEALKGVTGDPWAPVEQGKDGSKVLSVTADGFGWRRMRELLLSDTQDDRVFSLPLLAKPGPEDEGAVEIVAAALARGQGKTEGFHLRRVPIANRFAVRALGDDGAARARLSRVAQALTTAAMIAANKCLRPALFLLLQKGPEAAKLDRASTIAQVEPWMQRFDRRIDQAFFDQLWPGAESDAAASRALDEWATFLRADARAVFNQAAEAAPRADQRRILAEVRARQLLDGALRKNLPLSAERPKQAERAHAE
jgi:CRISPR system Cascade subunit CasA